MNSLLPSILPTNKIISLINCEIYKDFDNPKCRFGELSQSECCKSPAACIKKHKNEIKQTSFFEIDFEDAFLEEFIENCVFLSFSSVDHSTYSEVKVLWYFVEYILDTDNERLRSVVCNFLEDYFKMHPPCHPDLKQLYFTFVLGKVNINKNMEDGVLNTVIDNIYNILLNKNVNLNFTKLIQSHPIKNIQEIMEQNCNNPDVSLKDYFCDDEMERFNLPDSTTETKTLSSDEALRRYFLVLKLLVNLLKDELMAILVTCSFNLKRCINKKENRSIYTAYAPLIVRSIWRYVTYEQPGYVNEMCQKIITIFHKTTIEEHKAILYKYISLIAEVFRIKEKNPSTGNYHFSHVDLEKDSCIMYPCIGERCDELAFSVAQGFIDGHYPINDEVIQSVSLLEPPWLKLLVSNKLLNHLLKSDYKPDLSSVNKILIEFSKPTSSRSWKHPESCRPNYLSSTYGIHHCLGYVIVDKINMPNHSKRVILPKKHVNRQNSNGETLLHEVCRKGDHKRLKIFLMMPGVNVNIREKNGMTPLHEAIRSNHVKCVKLLLNYKPKNYPSEEPVDLNAENNMGRTPLIQALNTNNTEICKMIISKGGTDLLFYTNKLGCSVMSYVRKSKLLIKLLSVDNELNVSENTVLKLPDITVWLLMVMFQSYCETYHLINILKKINEKTFNTDYLNTHNKLYRKGKKKLDPVIKYDKYKEDLFRLAKICSLLNKFRNANCTIFPIKHFDTILGIKI
ncbi:uncharacterized protein LOC142331369 [Lycorma delicatula]|uniref:uncharacterized protein LOC142331369 n=1 Tax=Lycorma delicatula TaxID=130591 RepID=UPI003F50FF87